MEIQIATNEVISALKSLSSADHFKKLSHFGINTSKALGVKLPLIRQLAKDIGKNKDLAISLWNTEIHEARILASIILPAKDINNVLFDAWVYDFNSWDICDVSCGKLCLSDLVFSKIEEYSTNNQEFVKRTAFVLMCELAFHKKDLKDEAFDRYFEIIEREAWDDRNFVRKAVNWALRQIGKRNENLRLKALETAYNIREQHHKSAKWIANDAIRELTDDKVVDRVQRKKQ